MQTQYAGTVCRYSMQTQYAGRVCRYSMQTNEPSQYSAKQ